MHNNTDETLAESQQKSIKGLSQQTRLGVTTTISSDPTAEIMAIPISISASAATTEYGCKDSISSLVLSVRVHEGVHVLESFFFTSEVWFH
jgi:hypothetical protein